MKKTLFALKLSQVLFFIIMVTHNIFSILVNIFDHYPLKDYSIDNHLMTFFDNNFHHDYWGMAWYLVGMIGSVTVTLILSHKFKQDYIYKWLLYGMVILTIACGWWNFKLFISFF